MEWGACKNANITSREKYPSGPFVGLFLNLYSRLPPACYYYISSSFPTIPSPDDPSFHPCSSSPTVPALGSTPRALSGSSGARGPRLPIRDRLSSFLLHQSPPIPSLLWTSSGIPDPRCTTQGRIGRTCHRCPLLQRRHPRRRSQRHPVSRNDAVHLLPMSVPQDRLRLIQFQAYPLHHRGTSLKRPSLQQSRSLRMGLSHQTISTAGRCTRAPTLDPLPPPASPQ